MRLFHLMALAATVALAGTACGGGTDPSNNPPTAAFNAPTCVLLDCTFSGTPSTDGDGTVASYAWNFGDPGSGAQNTAPTADASHTFSAAGTYTVTLTVTDNGGASDDATQQVTVSLNPPPAADFDYLCSSLDCTFTNTSTDDGTFTSSWNFGDGSAASTETSPLHSYTATTLTTYTVTLTVTDAEGGTATSTQDVTVSPPATLTCGATPDCSLLIESARRVTVTLVSSDCQLSGNTFKVTIIPPGGGTPVEETLFTDGCNTPDNTSYQLQSNAVFAAGTEIEAQVISGGTTLELPPAVRVTGTFAAGWTLEFDDGAQSEPPEPDYNDLIIRIVAAP